MEMRVPDHEHNSPASASAVTRVGNDIGLNAPDAAFSGLAEMMRSFVALAEFLNLSHAVTHLDTTRQTVRRHIKLLETARGAPLFEVRDRQYSLTDAGRQALPEAEYILGRSQAWYNGQIGQISGLESVRRWEPHLYLLQQQPMSMIWDRGGPLLRMALETWTAAEGRLDHEGTQHLRAHSVVFRRLGANWICVDVGAKSSFASWFGETWERSAIGLPLGAMPGGRMFNLQANRPYDEIEATHGARYDHIHTVIPFGVAREARPISFKRLLLGCRFADDSFALLNMVVRSHDLRLDGVDEAVIKSMPEDLLME
jgi:hypothetical protein